MKYTHHPTQRYDEQDGENIGCSGTISQRDELIYGPDGRWPIVWECRFVTLFERFNSPCTPREYVQLKKEITEVHKAWRNSWRKVTSVAGDGSSVESKWEPQPWPKELEGITEEEVLGL